MPTREEYINQAIGYGIPMERIESFLAGNPGDEHRLLSALGGDYGHAEFDPSPSSSISEPGMGVVEAGHYYAPPPPPVSYGPPPPVSPIVSVVGPPLLPPLPGNGVNYMDPQLIANMPTATPPDNPQGVPTSQPEGWRDILGGIVSSLPIPGAGLIGGIIGGGGGGQPPGLQLPMPAPRPGGGLPVPRQPAPVARPAPPRSVGGGRSFGASFKLSPYINPRTGRNIPWSKVAKIGALAGMAGLTVEQFISNYGVPRDTPTMNPLNPRALKRAMNRQERFVAFARRAVKFSDRCGIKSSFGKKRKKRC